MFYITGTLFFRRWLEFTVGDILWYVLKLWGREAKFRWMKCFIFFLLFYNAFDLNNQKILCLPSIYQFERKLGFLTTLEWRKNRTQIVLRLFWELLRHCLNSKLIDSLVMFINCPLIKFSLRNTLTYTNGGIFLNSDKKIVIELIFPKLSLFILNNRKHIMILLRIIFSLPHTSS